MLAKNEKKLQKTLNELILQSHQIVSGGKLVSKAILTLNLQNYFRHLMSAYMEELDTLFNIAIDQIIYSLL